MCGVRVLHDDQCQDVFHREKNTKEPTEAEENDHDKDRNFRCLRHILRCNGNARIRRDQFKPVDLIEPGNRYAD